MDAWPAHYPSGSRRTPVESTRQASAIVARELSGSATGQSPAASMYEAFYGLAQSPFSLSPDPRFLYPSESHDAAIQQILRALRRREAFIVLWGEIGTGKTTICRALVPQLDRHVFASLVLNPFLAIDDLLRQVLIDFGVAPRDPIRRERFSRATTHELSTTLHDFLQSLAPIQGSAVLIVDEAQHLSPRVLEHLRVIAAPAGDWPPLQIVLVGQPILLEVLAAADLRQLDQRISLKALVRPLGRDDVEPYIAHRLAVAGESVAVAFERSAIVRIHELSGGVPRVINLLCDRALAAGAERGVHEITQEMIDQAADAVSFRRRPSRPVRSGRRPMRAALAALAVTGAIGTLALAAPLHRFVDGSLPGLPDSPERVPPIPLPSVPEDLRPIDVPVPEPGEVPDDFVAPQNVR